MAKQNSFSKTAVWAILLLLVVSLMGFGATNFGGGVTRVGEVGDTEISVDAYANAMSQELRSLRESGQEITMAEARQIGLDRIVLQRLVGLAALEDEAADLGLSVSDATVAEEIRGISAFQGAEGFNRSAYQDALARAGLDVGAFEEDIRAETARTLLQSALVSGIAPPDAFVSKLFDYARQTRDVTRVVFTPDDLDGPVPEPTDAEVAAFYEANPDLFTLPRRKAVSYVRLAPSDLTGTVEVSQADVEQLYEARSDEYRLPERRLVERLVFPDDAAADAAAEAIASGETDFDTLVSQRGLAIEDVDLGEVTRADLGAAAEAVFSAGTGIAGPADSSLGPAIYRVNAVLNAQTTPLEEVEQELREELALSRAGEQVSTYREDAADLLAGGATLEELAAETPFALGATVWSAGEAGLDGDDIDALPAFRDAAAAAEPGDFPELLATNDGGLIALRVDEVLEPELQSLEDVRDAATQGAADAALGEALRARAEEAQTALSDGTPVDELGGSLERSAGLLRDGSGGELPQPALREAFALDENETAVISESGAASLLRVDAIAAPSPEDGLDEARSSLAQAAGQGIGEDITSLFTEAMQQEKGISLNDQAVNAVLSQVN